ncbi:Transcription antitermination protein NusG [Macleaya cordata]|uniref:Transcription antitermination protein NusG n=1 Tax=Macleaya cordata TaxID=56857 RepID=A0A200QYI1_MACCD|nr:Transcription antitermination protein NusG [Macleaya cordata]
MTTTTTTQANNRKKHNNNNNNNNKKYHVLISSATLKEEEEEEEEEVEESVSSVSIKNGVGDQLLTGRERRQLRNERRESKALVSNWREEVEERLLNNKIPKKRYASWTEELNLDNLSLLGPQWWVVRVSRVSGQDTAESLARSLSRNFPNIDFKVYAPAVRVKRKLKNGTISVKPKPLFPGCVFLRCILNKEMHDFIRECPGVGGFVGSKVGNTKRQINRPKPVSSHDMEAIFQQAKEEQEKTDQAFEEDLQGGTPASEGDLSAYSKDVIESVTDAKLKRRLKKGSKTLGGNPSPGEDDKFLIPGSSIRVVSGPFMEFTGSLKKLDPKTGKATVGFMLFGKESLVKLDVNQIAVETS